MRPVLLKTLFCFHFHGAQLSGTRLWNKNRHHQVGFYVVPFEFLMPKHSLKVAFTLTIALLQRLRLLRSFQWHHCFSSAGDPVMEGSGKAGGSAFFCLSTVYSVNSHKLAFQIDYLAL